MDTVENHVKKASANAITILKRDCDAKITLPRIKIVKFEGKRDHWIALYRDLSQFSGTGVPIIWVDANIFVKYQEHKIPQNE